jgi:hypothetical protein
LVIRRFPIRQDHFLGFSGLLLMSENGARQPKYTVWALDTTGNQQRYVDIRVLDNKTVNVFFV